MQTLNKKIYKDLSESEQQLKNAIQKLNYIVQKEIEINKFGGQNDGKNKNEFMPKGSKN